MSIAVIIGAGQAGVQCAFSLRQYGWPGPVVLLGAEGTAPYQRPPLSKAYLAGEVDIVGTGFPELGLMRSRGVDVELFLAQTSRWLLYTYYAADDSTRPVPDPRRWRERHYTHRQ